MGSKKETTKIIIVGSSGHAKVVIDIFERMGSYEILGLLDPFREKGEETMGYKILGKIKELPELFDQFNSTSFFVAIGDNWIRHNVVNEIEQMVRDVNFATAIHPSAEIGKNVSIQSGSCVMAGAVINAATTIESHCILNTASTVDHDCTIRSFASLAPSACLGGNVVIGNCSAIALNATVSHTTKIGKHTVIGAGAVVLKDVPDQTVAYGTPAKVIRKREIGEAYLG